MAKRKKGVPRVYEVVADVQVSLTLDARGVTPEDAEATAETEVKDYLVKFKRDCEFRVDDAEVLSVTAEYRGEKDEDDDSGN